MMDGGDSSVDGEFIRGESLVLLRHSAEGGEASSPLSCCCCCRCCRSDSCCLKDGDIHVAKFLGSMYLQGGNVGGVGGVYKGQHVPAGGK